MGWPLDANDVTYGSLQPVTPANLNEIQARIVDLHRVRKHIVLEEGYPQNDGAGANMWEWIPAAGAVVSYWRSLCASAEMSFRCPARASGRLKAVRVKCYMPDANVPVLSLTRQTHNMGAAASAPTAAAIGSGASPTWGGGAGWDVVEWTGLDELIDDDESVRLHVMGNAAYAAPHQIAGVEFEIQPLTPTP